MGLAGGQVAGSGLGNHVHLLLRTELAEGRAFVCFARRLSLTLYHGLAKLVKGGSGTRLVFIQVLLSLLHLGFEALVVTLIVANHLVGFEFDYSECALRLRLDVANDGLRPEAILLLLQLSTLLEQKELLVKGSEMRRIHCPFSGDR